MNRLLRVGSAAALLVGVMSASHLSLPGFTVAFASPEGQELVTEAVRTVSGDTAPGAPPDVELADAPPDLGLVAIALVTFVAGLTAVAALLAFARRREPPPPDKPDQP